MAEKDQVTMAPPPSTVPDIAEEKRQADHREDIDVDRNNSVFDADDKKVAGGNDVERDYTGVAKKTDPVEIALVKKLDWMIMVSRCTATPSPLILHGPFVIPFIQGDQNVLLTRS